MKKIIIFGSGISGLTCAQELIEKNFEVHVYEKDHMIGGMARSFRYKNNVPTEHSWRGYAEFYYNVLDILSRIPTNYNVENFDNQIHTYNIDEVAKHNTDKDAWVYYKGYVYDITEFIHKHPGGSIILNSLGGDLELAWKNFGVEWHNHNIIVQTYLNQYKIGKLIDNSNTNENHIPLLASNNLTKATLDFNLYKNDLSHINQKIEVDYLDYPYLMYIFYKVICSNNRNKEYFAQKLMPYLKNKISENSYHYLMDYLSGPGFGFDKNNASLGTFATFLAWEINTGSNGWKVMNQPTNEAWFDHWSKYLINKGVKFHFNQSLDNIAWENNKIKYCIVNKNEIVNGDEFIICINPNNLYDIFNRSKMFNLANQHKKLSVTNNQISFRIGFNKKINFPIKNGGYVLVDSPYNITFYAQEDLWKPHIELGLDGKIKSLWSGTCITPYNNGNLYGLPGTKLDKIKLMREIAYQFFQSKELYYIIKNNNNEPLKLDDINYMEIFDDWYWNNNELKSKNLKWVNTYINEQYRPNNNTAYENMYLAGAHTKTSTNIWSMESATESGKLASNLILNKYNLPMAYVYTHIKTPIQRVLSTIDDSLYFLHLPNIIDVFLLIILVILFIFIYKLGYSWKIINPIYLIVFLIILIFVFIKYVLKLNIETMN